MPSFSLKRWYNYLVCSTEYSFYMLWLFLFCFSCSVVSLNGRLTGLALDFSKLPLVIRRKGGGGGLLSNVDAAYECINPSVVFSLIILKVRIGQ